MIVSNSHRAHGMALSRRSVELESDPDIEVWAVRIGSTGFNFRLIHRPSGLQLEAPKDWEMLATYHDQLRNDQAVELARSLTGVC
jgi:hypothetical protein